jgi:hypothetical protein
MADLTRARMDFPGSRGFDAVWLFPSTYVIHRGDLGIRVVRVWECDLTERPTVAMRKIQGRLRGRRPPRIRTDLNCQ